MEISFSFPRRGLPSRGGSLLALSAATSTLCFQVSFAARWIRAAIKGGAGEEGNNKIRGASRVFPSFANQPRENKRGGEKGISFFVVFWPWAQPRSSHFSCLAGSCSLSGTTTWRRYNFFSRGFFSSSSSFLLFFACLLLWIMGNLVDARLVRSKCTIKVVFRDVFLEIEIK